MKNRIFTLLVLLCTTFTTFAEKNNAIVDYVNPLVGSDSDFSLSNGNTYPAIALPWGMNFWTPQTGPMGDGWTYAYHTKKIRGFKQTHQPSPWINDYAAFSIFPETGDLKILGKDRAAWFSHKAEVAKPNYYRVYLADYDVTTEITPTERAAHFRFTFPKTDQAHILVDGFYKGSQVKIYPKERKIVGYCRNNSGGVPENFHNYFVIYFDKDFKSVGTWESKKSKNPTANYAPNSKEAEGYHVGAVLTFETEAGEQIHARVASSFISPEQAELNLKREIGNDSFKTTKEKATLAWNKELSKIKVEGGTTDQYRTFYTALYRTMLFPRKFYEYNSKNEIVHYSPYNGKVEKGYMFTDNGFWDTFRAVFPFFTLMYPELDSHIMQGLANTYKESGWLPEWASPGHRDCMIGSNSASLITDAYLKGIRGFDIETLYQAIIKNTKSKGPLNSVGRYGAEEYNKYGYVPYDSGVNENAARTLEYAYADWCIYELSKALDKPKDQIDLFAKRANNYKNLFDSRTGFMSGKNMDGSWSNARPDKWGDAFTEGSAWHYTWSVFHDPKGLATLYGSNEKMAAQLDRVFTSAPTFDDSYYGFQIHEITEMLIADMGQYAHGNQPVQHAIYLYNWLGQPWKAQYWTRNVMDKLYTPNADGLCGDEDNGQTSAWYVFSAMGFYPVAPGTGEYAIGSPLFKKITLTLENGKKFVIQANNNNHSNVYIKDATLNGNTFSKNYITHKQLTNGGTLKLNMSSKPNKKRGTKASSFPYSFSNEKR
ncbi:GH92 family glycosyl hydrolase [Halosquirtibacter xylanolyticus]|uniref:GH92 family glycosyl hydrolase n=1 Tax=Halosquirtibacter xylanolyticus TaxID=3374599 RepID=UPI00374A70E5|nr:GH92 family glycosyl hydrolase [Prolixibacteraceae bacterium]